MEYEDNSPIFLFHSYSAKDTPFYVVNNDKNRRKNRYLLMQQIVYIETHLKRLKNELKSLE
jgi:hypothetical protein